MTYRALPPRIPPAHAAPARRPGPLRPMAAMLVAATLAFRPAAAAPDRPHAPGATPARPAVAGGAAPDADRPGVRPAMTAAAVEPAATAAAPATPVASAVTLAPAAPPARTAAIALDFPRGTGAAVLRRGDTVLAVFDSPELRNPDALLRFGPAAAIGARALEQGFVLTFPAGGAGALGVSRGLNGWVLGPLAAATRGGAPPAAEATLANLPGPAPVVAIEGVPAARILVVHDPDSGLPLLIGTTREAGRGFAGGRRTPEYDLLETQLGVAVLARSESLRMQASSGRFLLSGSLFSPLPLDAASVGPTAGATLTRCLGLPDLPPDRLLARLRTQAADLAGTEPLGRAARRRELAATLLALGLAHEAQAEMARAFTEDTDAAARRGGRTLAAAAALLAGRLEAAVAAVRAEAAGAGCDELALWRSLVLAQSGDAAAAAAGLRAALPLVGAYPAGLRDRLAPLVADAFVQAGAWRDLRALLAEAGTGARLPLAAAALLEAEGDAEAALVGYDAVLAGRDRRARALALRRAVELRLRTGLVDAADAARAHAPSLVAWRGDALERDARFRQAELLALSDDPVAAVGMLRQTAALFPDQAAKARAEAGRILRAALAADRAPLAAVAAFQAGADLLPADERAAAEVRLVEVLEALDLPGRAAAVLDQAVGHAAAGPARAEIGWRLAALRMRENDAAGARAALDATDAPDASAPVRERREALAAAIAGRAGEAEARPGTEPAEAAGAEAALGRRDWGAAARALARQLDGRLSADAAELAPDVQDAVLRLAAALALAGDDAAVAALRARIGSRMGSGPQGDAFRRLVADPAPPEAAASTNGLERPGFGLAAR
jgi:hypothetical protein